MWTGTEACWFGGRVSADGQAYGDGACYDPQAGPWRPMSATDAPSPRWNLSLVWTGTAACVFGGHTREGAWTGGEACWWGSRVGWKGEALASGGCLDVR